MQFQQPQTHGQASQHILPSVQQHPVHQQLQHQALQYQQQQQLQRQQHQQQQHQHAVHGSLALAMQGHGVHNIPNHLMQTAWMGTQVIQPAQVALQLRTLLSCSSAELLLWAQDPIMRQQLGCVLTLAGMEGRLLELLHRHDAAAVSVIMWFLNAPMCSMLSSIQNLPVLRVSGLQLSLLLQVRMGQLAAAAAQTQWHEMVGSRYTFAHIRLQSMTVGQGCTELACHVGGVLS